MSKEAMQMALHTLEGWENYANWVWPDSALEQAKRNTTESIAALRQALETEREWVGLTDEEIGEVISGQFAERNYWVKITKALEAKLKEKNHG